MKIYDYPSSIELAESDVFLVDGGGTSEKGLGTRKILTKDAIPSMIDQMVEEPWVMHRNLYRGKYLGDRVSEEQIAHIHDGSFKDLYVGDYWVIDDVTYRIADINYFKDVNQYPDSNPSSSATDISAKNHLVIVPDATEKYISSWSSSSSVATGYMGSYIRTTGIVPFRNAILSAFPNMIIPHFDRMLNSVTYGTVLDGAYAVVFDAMIELMSTSMTAGRYTPYATTHVNIRTNNTKQQLSLFKLNPSSLWVKSIKTDSQTINHFWTTDPTYSGAVGVVSDNGIIESLPVNSKSFIRPYFCIG